MTNLKVNQCVHKATLFEPTLSHLKTSLILKLSPFELSLILFIVSFCLKLLELRL